MKIKLRPSDASCWMICRAAPGYVAANLSRIPPEDKPYADEGAQAHEVAERVLRHTVAKGLPPSAAGHKIPKEMARHVEGYARFIQSLFPTDGTTFWFLVEKPVNVYYAQGRTGKIDAALVGLDGRTITRLHIVDLKYGRGDSVQAEHNHQLSIYFVSLLRQLQEDYQLAVAPDVEALITVWQPRIQGEAPERTWRTTVGELEKFAQQIATVARTIEQDPLRQPFVPGDSQCKYCLARSLCEARTRWLLGEAELEPVAFGATKVEATLPPVRSLSQDHMARVLAVAPLLRKWLDDLENHCEALAVQEGQRIPGHKLVASSPKRRWRDPDEALEWLALRLLGKPVDLLTTPELRSPAQVEEALADLPEGPAMLKELRRLHIVRPEGKPILVPLDDKRPEWRDVDPEAEFENGLL